MAPYGGFFFVPATHTPGKNRKRRRVSECPHESIEDPPHGGKERLPVEVNAPLVIGLLKGCFLSFLWWVFVVVLLYFSY